MGGFTVYGAGETTSYNIAGVDVSGKTITITFTSGTAPRERGTYVPQMCPDVIQQISMSNMLEMSLIWVHRYNNVSVIPVRYSI